jgi:hypothetical protein
MGLLYLKLKSNLETYWMRAPTMKATNTDNKMPAMMARAFSEFI